MSSSRSFCASPKPSAVSVDDYIDAYDRYAAEKLGIYVTKKTKGKKGKNKTAADADAEKIPTVRKYRDIRDFMYMKTPDVCGEEAGYMDLTEFRNTRTPLENVRELRQRWQQKPETGSAAAPAKAKPAEKQQESGDDYESALAKLIAKTKGIR